MPSLFRYDTPYACSDVVTPRAACALEFRRFRLPPLLPTPIDAAAFDAAPCLRLRAARDIEMIDTAARGFYAVVEAAFPPSLTCPPPPPSEGFPPLEGGR